MLDREGPDIKLVADAQFEDGRRERQEVPFAESSEELAKKERVVEAERRSRAITDTLEAAHGDSEHWTAEEVQEYADDVAGLLTDLLSDPSDRARDVLGYADVFSVLSERMVGARETLYHDDGTSTDADIQYAKETAGIVEQVNKKLFPDVQKIEPGQEVARLAELQDRLNATKTLKSHERLLQDIPEADDPIDVIDALIEGLERDMAAFSSLEPASVHETLGVDPEHGLDVVAGAKTLYELQLLRDTYETTEYGRAGRTADERAAIDEARSAVDSEFIGTGPEQSAPTGRESLEVILQDIPMGALNDEIKALKAYENLDDPEQEEAAKDAANLLDFLRRYHMALERIDTVYKRSGQGPSAKEQEVLKRLLSKAGTWTEDEVAAAGRKIKHPDLKLLLRKFELAAREQVDAER